MMTLGEIQEILEARVLVAAQEVNLQIEMACGCDLMSDVLSFTKEHSLLLTGLTNVQVVRTAEMANIKAVVFVRGKKPDRETIALAAAQQIPLLMTDLLMYEACGRLYKHGLKGCSEVQERCCAANEV